MLRHVLPHIGELLPIITTLGITFVTIVGVKAFLGVTFGGMFLTLAGFLLPHSRGESSANIEAGPLKVRWEGAATMALLVAGVLMLMLALFAFVYSRQVL
jgi:hypothetical protein